MPAGPSSPALLLECMFSQLLPKVSWAERRSNLSFAVRGLQSLAFCRSVIVGLEVGPFTSREIGSSPPCVQGHQIAIHARCRVFSGGLCMLKTQTQSIGEIAGKLATAGHEQCWEVTNYM